MVHVTLINGAEMLNYKNTPRPRNQYNQIIKLQTLIKLLSVNRQHVRVCKFYFELPLSKRTALYVETIVCRH